MGCRLRCLHSLLCDAELHCHLACVARVCIAASGLQRYLGIHRQFGQLLGCRSQIQEALGKYAVGFSIICKAR